MYSGETAQLIELPFEMVSRLGPRNWVLNGCAHWRHLAHTVKRLCAAAVSGSATRGGDAASSQIALVVLLLLMLLQLS